MTRVKAIQVTVYLYPSHLEMLTWLRTQLNKRTISEVVRVAIEELYKSVLESMDTMEFPE